MKCPLLSYWCSSAPRLVATHSSKQFSSKSNRFKIKIRTCSVQGRKGSSVEPNWTMKPQFFFASSQFQSSEK